MKAIDAAVEKYKELSAKEKIKLVVAFTMTIIVLISAPTLAWFSQQKQIATMAKVDSPAKLSLKAGAREDIINFKMAGIDVTKGNSKDFVFCVEGEDISSYNIQLAHTTNINFTYTIYQAKEAETGVEYVRASDSNPVYYQKAGEPLSGDFVNDTYDEKSGRNVGNTQYEDQSYKNGKNPDQRQKFAEPLYWQTDPAIEANDDDYDADDDERSFINYYVLEVTWGAGVINDKETDLVYLTAQVAQ